MIRLMVKPVHGTVVKFGKYTSIEDATEAAIQIKRIFNGRVYIEHTPPPLELILKGLPEHTDIIEV